MSRLGMSGLLAALLLSPSSNLLSQSDPVDLVNPLVGTGGEGQTFPATGMPFGMTQWTPQTRAGEAKCVAPYYHADTRIQGFRGSHFLSGSCTQDYGSVTLMPLTSVARLDPEGRSSAFDHSAEKTHPYLYQIDLKSTKIGVKMTGTERSGMLSFQFPTASAAWVAIENNARPGSGSTRIDMKRQEITGYNEAHRIYAGQGKKAGFSGYFIIQFDHPFKMGGAWNNHAKYPGKAFQNAASASSGAYIAFEPGENRVILARIGTSFTSLEEARRNLDAEIPDWDFDAVVARARAAWANEMNHIQVAGSSPDRVIFYTALYHSMLLPASSATATAPTPASLAEPKSNMQKALPTTATSPSGTRSAPFTRCSPSSTRLASWTWSSH